MLERRLSGPSTDLSEIRARQDAVAFFVSERLIRDEIEAHLRRIPDLDRALSRLALDRGGPRDLAAIRDGLAGGRWRSGQALDSPDLPGVLAEARAGLSGHDDLRDLLDTALVAEPPLQLRDGSSIAAGHSADLDEVRQLRDEGRGVIAGMQAEFIEATGVSSLKIKHNNVLGYFIETSVGGDPCAEDAVAAAVGAVIHRQIDGQRRAVSPRWSCRSWKRRS